MFFHSHVLSLIFIGSLNFSILPFFFLTFGKIILIYLIILNSLTDITIKIKIEHK